MWSRTGASSKSREPASAMAVNEPGLGSSADGKGEEGIDRSLERAATPLYLGEEKSSFERGEHSRGEDIRGDAGRRFPVTLNVSHPLGQCARPPTQPRT